MKTSTRTLMARLGDATVNPDYVTDPDYFELKARLFESLAVEARAEGYTVWANCSNELAYEARARAGELRAGRSWWV